MDALHKEVLVADDCLAIAECGAVYDNVFPDIVIVADYQARLVAAEIKVLRVSAQHGVLEYAVAASHACAVHYADVRIDYAVVAYDNVAFDVRKRIDGHVLADTCVRVDVCFVAYLVHDSLF